MQSTFFRFLFLIILLSTSILGFSQYVVLDQYFEKYDIIHIESQNILSKINNNRSDILEMSFLNHEMQLHTSNIISNNYKLRVNDESGERFIQTKRAIPMRGSTSNGGLVSLTFNDNFIHGFIEDGDETYFIEPLYNFEKGKSNDLYVYYNTKDIIEGAPKTCGVTAMQAKEKEISREVNSGSRMPGQCFEVEWAIANDWLMFQSYGSVGAVENHAIGVANDVQTNYDDEFADELQLFISEQFVSACSTCDPWSSTTNAGALLNSFRNWGGSGFSFNHDVGSLWTNRNFDGSTIGIAFVGTVCGFSRYNCLEDFSNSANLKRVMVAHELGHNFDAVSSSGTGHDPGGSPFIMAPSVSNVTAWSTASMNDIESYYLSIGCLSSCSTSSAPTADFSFNYLDQCLPGNVDFFDNSTGTVTGWDWSFPGGNPATSTLQNPNVSYTAAGVYDVTLTVFNGGLSNTITLTQIIEIFDYPTSEFDFIVNGSDVEFINLSQNSTSFIWDFGDGNTSNLTNPTHTYSDDGNYFVSLIAINSCGTDFFNFEVVIATPPVPDFSATPTSGCTPLVVTYANQSSSNVIDYFWEFEGGSPSTSTDENPVVLYSDSGLFATKLTVTNPQGIVAKEEVGYITVNQTPSADFTQSASGTVVNFTNTSIGGDSYTWDFGDGNASSLENPTHTYASSGTYDVTLVAISNNCPNNTITKSVVISLEPQAGFTTAGLTEGCISFDVQFEDNSTNNPTSWAWTFEGGSPANSTDQNPMITYDQTGSFDVTLIATNALGADTLTLSEYIEVSTTPTSLFTFSKEGSVVAFTNQTIDGDTYLWDFGDGNTSTDIAPTHDYMQEGSWVVVLNSTNECGSTDQTLILVTTLSPIAGLQYNNAPICGGELISFMDNSTNTVDSWLWTFEGGTPNTSTDANPTVTYNTPGIYDVTLEVTNSEGSDQTTISNAVTVLAQPVADINSSVNGNIITYTYNGNSNDNILWTLPDGSNSSDQSISFTAPENGNYEATIVVSNQCGEVNGASSQSINVYPTAAVTLSETIGCADFTTTFSAEDVVGATYNWSFEGGDPATSTDQNPTVTYSSRGSFDISLEVSNTFGSDTYTNTDAITVEVNPTSEFTSTYNGIELTTTNTSQFASEYLWDFGDGSTSTDQTPTHQYQTDGTYVVTLTTTNECGTAISTQTIEVIILVPSISYEASITSGCAPLEVVFTDFSGNDPTSYMWTFEGGTPATSTDQNPVVVYNEAGVYDVAVTMSNSAGNSTLTQTDYIVVNDVPLPDFGFTTIDGTVDFQNMSSANSDSYSWDFGDGNTSDEVSPSNTYTASGDYIVTLTTTNECGSTTVSKTVTIVISSIYDVDFLTHLNIYPNPFNDNFKVEASFTNKASGSIVILDNIGKQILKTNFTNSNNINQTLDLNRLASGMYLVKIQSGGKYVVRKIIKN